jgi:hypothetical protein
METTLARLVEEAAANDPRRLKTRIAELERALAKGPNAAAAPNRKEIEAAETRARAEGRQEGRVDAMAEFVQTIKPLVEKGAALIAVGNELANALHAVAPGLAAKVPAPAPRPAIAAAVPRPARPAPAARISAPRPQPSNDVAEPLPKGERICLTAIAQHRDGVTREQLTVLTSYKRSSRDTYLQRLRERGHIAQLDGRLFSTPEGDAALGPDFERLPVGDDLREHWLARLPEGERRVLEAVIGFYPDAATKAEIDEATDYKRSSRDTYIQRLRARELVITDRDGVRAADTLFG